MRGPLVLLLLAAPATAFTALHVRRALALHPALHNNHASDDARGSVRRALGVVGSSRDAFQREVDQAEASDAAVTTIADPTAPVSDQWELDCYSRPVSVGGKKLWELLVVDASGNFRHVEPIPANKVTNALTREAGPVYVVVVGRRGGAI